MMAAALRSLTRTAVVTARANFRALPVVPAPLLANARSLAARAGKGAPAPEPVDADMDDFEMGDFDPLEGMTSHTKRRVMALKEVQSKYDTLNRVYQQELAQLQAKFLEKYAPLFNERKAIASGAQKVGDYGIEDDGEPDTGKVDEFWLTAMYNHDKVGSFVTERDAEVLQHLVDVRLEVLAGEERGFKLFFEFEPNKFFTNKVLEKTYILEPEDDLIPKNFLGTKIDWKDAALDVTTEQKKKRVKGKDGPKGGKPAFSMESVPCESFFNFFDPPQIPERPEELDDEQMGALQEELSMDFDIGFAFKENIIPRAVEWFTGEIAPIDGDFDEGYDEEEEEEYEPEPPRKGGRR
mmetsp:Transcript_7295/g.18064  ORF Transcript_7295/g.18064 Transcript_7295/m.18064 type:complete len:352 (-) Transcript_7295:342-1397(-)